MSPSRRRHYGDRGLCGLKVPSGGPRGAEQLEAGSALRCRGCWLLCLRLLVGGGSWCSPVLRGQLKRCQGGQRGLAGSDEDQSLLSIREKRPFNSLYHQTQEGTDFAWSLRGRGLAASIAQYLVGTLFEQGFSIPCEINSDVPQELNTFWGDSVSYWDLG